MSELSTKPYLIRAIYEWCSDNGYRPYIAVVVDETTEVPFEFVRNGEIVLNVSAEATNHLVLGNDLIEFEARFNRVARNVSVPIANVTAIYAAENGHGMAFEVPKAPAIVEPKPSRTSKTLRDVTPPLEGEPAQEGATAATPALTTVASRRRSASSKSESASGSAQISLVPSGDAEAPNPASVPGSGPTDPAGQAGAVGADGLIGENPVGQDQPDAQASPSASGEEPVPPDASPPRKGGRPRLTRVK